MAPQKALKVFVSSTSDDLRNYRGAARQVILEMGWNPEMMEHFGTNPQSTVAACREKLAECDLLLLIMAYSRGAVPTTEQGGDGVDSITALELDFARKRGMPVLAMLASESWPDDLWEKAQEAREWVGRFRAALRSSAFFFDAEPTNTPDPQQLQSFRVKVREALESHRERLFDKGKKPSSVAPATDYTEAAKGLLEGGMCIPFLGQGIYGTDGPLSINSLVRSLIGQKTQLECLATAAEYYESQMAARKLLLKEISKAVEEQSKEVPFPPVYEMLLCVKPPRLIVSTTCDLVLEKTLKDRGKRIVLITHIVRSSESRDKGQILVIKGEEHWICAADKVEIGDEKEIDYIIYKPLGSPLIPTLLDSDQNIDTVVMTERDHLVFLRHLQQQGTGVPTCFSSYFREYRLLFLGYPLDVWHYRLVMKVLESFGREPVRPSSLAVRVPASSPMEELAWQRLKADLIPMDPNVFARRVLESMAGR